MSPRGCGEEGEPRRLSVHGSLPLHPEAAAYELRRGTLLLHRAEVAAAPPRVARARCRRTAKGLALRWECEGDDTGVSYNVAARTESGRRITLARGLTERRFTVDPESILAAGRVRVVVEASDGVRSSEAEATTVELGGRPPTAHILSPADGLTLPYGQPVSAAGCCLDASGQPLPPEGAAWLLDGEELSAGDFNAAVERPRPGEHRLTLAYGEGPARAEASVRFVVEEPDDDYRQWAEMMGEPDDEPPVRTAA